MTPRLCRRCGRDLQKRNREGDKAFATRDFCNAECQTLYRTKGMTGYAKRRRKAWKQQQAELRAAQQRARSSNLPELLRLAHMQHPDLIEFMGTDNPKSGLTKPARTQTPAWRQWLHGI